MEIPVALDQYSDDLLGQFWRLHRSGAPSHVYHYTSAAGLCGILESNSIWATDCRSLNDVSESQVGVNKAKEIAQRRRFFKTNEDLREFYRELSRILRLEDPDPNFVFSLSERDDDLTQWRTYANDGLGFTIGFSSEKLLENSQDNNGEFEFSKVVYSTREQDSMLRDLFAQVEARIRQDKHALGDKCYKSNDYGTILDWLISNYSTLFKHSSFKSEKEWRVNTYNLTDESSQSVKVRARGGRLIPYIPLNLGKLPDEKLPIARIGIGPSFKDPTVKYAVEKLCEQADYDVEIYNADSPYRRL